MFWSLVAMAVLGVYVGFALIAAKKTLWFKPGEIDEDLLTGFGPGTVIRPE